MNPDDPLHNRVKANEEASSLDPYATRLSDSPNPYPLNAESFEPDSLNSEPSPGGATFCGYRLFRELGQGGMGIVYEVEPLRGGERCALKVLKAGSTAALSKLKAEFRVVADLAHLNLVRLGELNTTSSKPYFTMELLNGEPFDRHVRAGFESVASTPSLPYSEARLRSSLRQLAEGLVALHNAGLIHRDIKPSNVLITTEGRVVILDLGLTIEMDGAAFKNSRREMSGTPYFMAPEQARGEAITPACDWYSVGVMLYEALTGEQAFQSHQWAELIAEKSSRVGPWPRDVLSEIPEDLDRLCRDLLHADPADRPRGEDILTLLSGEPSSALESTTWIGRDDELQTLRQCWTQVRGGVPSVIFVSGQSGLGKTSLVDVFLSKLRSEEAVVTLRGRCYENESVSYRGFDSVVDSLATYLGRLPKHEVERVLPIDIDMLVQLFPVIGEVPFIANHRLRGAACLGEPRELRQRGIAALRELLSRLARFVPVVIFIDDLQQGDEDTAAIFRELFRKNHSPAVLFIATFRSEDSDTNACLRLIRHRMLPLTERVQFTDQVEIEIGKLSREESIRLAASLLIRNQVNCMEDVSKIADESEGDPLFVRMLTQHRIRHLHEPSDTVTGPSIRWTLSSVIEDRIKSLPQDERTALEVLAAAGRPIDEATLNTVVGRSRQTIGMIRSLRVKRLVRRLGDRERIEPFHDKIRDAILKMASRKRLASLSLSIAETLDRDASDRDVEFLAELYRRGGDRPHAGECYESAARIAESTFAFQRAIECYRFALDLLQTTGEHRRRLHRGLGDALANASRSAEAAKQYLLAAKDADVEVQAKLKQLASLRYLTSGHVEEGVDALRGVLAHHQLPWPKNRLLAVAGLLMRIGYLRLRGLKVRNDRQPTPEALTKLDACWTAAAGLSLVDPLRGSYYIAENLCRSLRIGSVATVPRDLAAYMGQVAIGGIRSRNATYRVLLACRQAAVNKRDPYSKAMQFLSRGIAALLRGQWSACLGCCDHALKYLSDASCYGKTWELNTARTFGLWALQYQGNFVELSRRQPELLRVAKESDDLFATLNFGTQVMAHLQLAAGDPEESLRRLAEDKARLSDRGFYIQHHNYILAKTYTLLYQGHAMEAVSTIDGTWKLYQHEFLSHIQQVRIDHHQVAARAFLAAAEQTARPERVLTKAKQLIGALRRENAGWATALAEAFEAGCFHVMGNQSGARDRLLSAITLLDLADMRLFSAAASHHLAHLTGQGFENSEKRWFELGIADGAPMAQMLVPGFGASVKVSAMPAIGSDSSR